MWYLYLLALGFLPKQINSLVLKEGVGKLPALGWNSWNAYNCEITESQFLSAAQKLVDLGLKDLGYEYINIDDCWSVKETRDNQTHRLLPDLNKFPDGINGTAAKIHDMGLKIGIYSSAGTKTCAGWVENGSKIYPYPASIGYEAVDAATWAEWGIDYLKYDNCNIPKNWTDPCTACVPDYRDYDHKVDLVNGSCTEKMQGLCPPNTNWSKSNTAKRYSIMRDALVQQDRPILYSLCEWGEAGVQQWGNATGSSWRMSGDIEPTWPRILSILNQNSFYLNHVNFWGHSDMDMLEVGNGINIQESRSHFALWAAMKSPLLIGTDLANIDQGQLEVLKNKPLIAFNQDKVYGKPAQPYKWGTNPNWTFNSSFPAEYWSGPSTAGTLVLLLNPYEDTRTKVADWTEVPELKARGAGKRVGFRVTDVWTGKDLGCVVDSLKAQVQRHDTAAFLVKERCSKYAKPPPSDLVGNLKRRLLGDW